MSILLTPARIGRVEIPNRIVMPPMTTRTADEDGGSPRTRLPITRRGRAAAWG
jgi:2,4-dienoyl-CoA reductase-like NADH-dependent reductase (Old Yellow Enzyme family)